MIKPLQQSATATIMAVMLCSAAVSGCDEVVSSLASQGVCSLPGTATRVSSDGTCRCVAGFDWCTTREEELRCCSAADEAPYQNEEDSVCGDGQCTGEENAETCPQDCSPHCGDGICSPGEDEDSCPEDCVQCGDGTCQRPFENALTCPADCPAVCGDGVCTHDENFTTCPQDCRECNNNGICDGGETPLSCPIECPPEFVDVTFLTALVGPRKRDGCRWDVSCNQLSEEAIDELSAFLSRFLGLSRMLPPEADALVHDAVAYFARLAESHSAKPDLRGTITDERLGGQTIRVPTTWNNYEARLRPDHTFHRVRLDGTARFMLDFEDVDTFANDPIAQQPIYDVHLLEALHVRGYTHWVSLVLEDEDFPQLLAVKITVRPSPDQPAE